MLARLDRASNPADATDAQAAGGETSIRTIAVGSGWRFLDIVCRAGPRSRPFEEEHEWVSVSLVVSGHFTYRSQRGRALLAPGMLLLGRHGDAFTCSHEHGSGDRCLALQYEAGLFERLAAVAPDQTGPLEFARPALPPLRRLSPLAAAMQAPCDQPAAPTLALDELVVSAPPLVLAAVAARRSLDRSATPADERRIAAATRFIEGRLKEDLSLQELADFAGVTPWHFLRVFQQVLGTTPHQWLLSRRLAAASRRLLETNAPVATIALGVGFGDLSNFNAAFKRAFGATPREHRLRRSRGLLSER